MLRKKGEPTTGYSSAVYATGTLSPRALRNTHVCSSTSTSALQFAATLGHRFRTAIKEPVFQHNIYTVDTITIHCKRGIEISVSRPPIKIASHSAFSRAHCQLQSLAFPSRESDFSLSSLGEKATRHSTYINLTKRSPSLM